MTEEEDSMLTEEEKLAIEHIKNYPTNWLFLEVDKKAIDTVLNLIEKLQKENEELRVQGSIILLDYNILKDKIEEKLKWYEDTCERLSKSGIELDMYDRYQGAIELCKELLEEN